MLCSKGSQSLRNMKRVYQPYGSPRAKQASKRVRQAPVPTYRRKYIPRGQNTYSAFQKSSGIERKNIDDSSAKWASTSAGWSINCLNDVAQGTTAITRIGRKILMKSILVQGILATNTGNNARVLIVYDRQPNGALPAATDVLTSNTIMAVQNLDNRDRFLILADIMPYDQVENISNPSANSGFGYKRYIKCNLETIYSGNAGTIADIMSGSLIMMTNCNAGTLTGETGIQRVRFVDE